MGPLLLLAGSAFMAGVFAAWPAADVAPRLLGPLWADIAPILVYLALAAIAASHARATRPDRRS